MKAFVGTRVNASRFRIWTVLITPLLELRQPDLELRLAHQLFTTVTSRCMIGGPIVQPPHLCRRQLVISIEETRFGQSGFHGLTFDGIADQCTHHRYTIIASSCMQVNMPMF